MRNKLLLSLLFTSTLLINSILAAVNSDSAIATAKVQVESVFEIGLNRTDIDFETMKPGETKYDIPASGIQVTSKSNTGNKWYLFINSLSELKDGDKYIDNDNFIWYGWTEGKGTWFGTGDNSMKLTPIMVYESSADEGVNYPQGTNNFFKFKLTIPKNQIPGNYSSIIRFTITE